MVCGGHQLELLLMRVLEDSGRAQDFVELHDQVQVHSNLTLRALSQYTDFTG